MLPKPWLLARPFLDAYHIIFKVKFDRRDTVTLYHELQFNFANLCQVLQTYKSSPTHQESLLQALIKQCQKNCDQIIVLSLQSYHLGQASRWSNFEVCVDWMAQVQRKEWFKQADFSFPLSFPPSVPHSVSDELQPVLHVFRQDRSKVYSTYKWVDIQSDLHVHIDCLRFLYVIQHLLTLTDQTKHKKMYDFLVQYNDRLLTIRSLVFNH